MRMIFFAYIRDFCYNFVLNYSREKSPDGNVLIFALIFLHYYLSFILAIIILFEQKVFPYMFYIKNYFFPLGIIFGMLMFVPYIFILRALYKKLEKTPVKIFSKRQILWGGLVSILVFIGGFIFLGNLMIFITT